jgi:protein-disulfide isomerase
MKSILSCGAAALALLLAGCGEGGGNQAAGSANDAPIAQIPAPNGDWTQMVRKTAEGGFLMGNPDAKAKLVEYGSLSCPHCAEFEEEGAGMLRDKYVKSGQLSYEFRTYLLFPTDPGVSALVHCQGEAAAFPLIEQLYADQSNWLGRIQSLPPEQLQQIQTMPPQQAAAAVVTATGLTEFFQQRGMPESRIRSCLADPAGYDMLAGIKKRGDEEGVNGTPTFFLNGKVVEMSPGKIWPQLEPQLQQAIR